MIKEEEEDFKKTISVCKVCGEPTQIKIDGIDHIFPTACKCRRLILKKEAEEERAKNIQRQREISIQTIKFRDYTFENDDLKDLKTTNLLKKYILKFPEMKERGLGLLFFGSVGTGKTFYAYCIVNALIDLGYKVSTTTLSEVIRIAQNFDINSDKSIYRILNNDVILIDDIGVERQTSFADEQIYNFIDKAISRNKVLILTTNLMLSEFEAATQDSSDLTHARIYSRILEKCFPIKVEKVKRRDILKEDNRSYMLNILKE